MSRKAGSMTENTKAKLIESAELEFAKQGYQKASLRSICRRADVTTGALYFFFNDKDDLFRHVVSPITDTILVIMKQHHETERNFIYQGVLEDEDENYRVAEQIINLYYEHETIWQIVLNNREHPFISVFFDTLTEMLGNQTKYLLESLDISHDDPLFNECTIHWFSHLQLDSILLILSHPMSIEEAKHQLKIMVNFLRGGFFYMLSKNQNMEIKD